jgi:hypothetical protein
MLPASMVDISCSQLSPIRSANCIPRKLITLIIHLGVFAGVVRLLQNRGRQLLLHEDGVPRLKNYAVRTSLGSDQLVALT